MSKAYDRQDIGGDAEQPAERPKQLNGQLSSEAGRTPGPQPADMQTNAQAVQGADAITEGNDSLLVPDSEEELLSRQHSLL